MLAGCNALLSVFFFMITLYDLKLVGRVNVRLVFHTIICCVTALGAIKIEQHPEWLLDSEGRARPLFRR